jgi:hypothetical protein
MTISLAYACETIDIMQAEAYLAERRYNQFLVAAKPYRILMERTREDLDKAKEDLRDFARYVPPHRVAALLNRVADGQPRAIEHAPSAVQRRAPAGMSQSNYYQRRTQ